ncbi:MAG: F0F1 ATP synthase subunit delta [Gammaproteobacteria bacterium]
MADNATLARPYAVAAYDFATEAKAVEAWSGVLDTLAAVVSDPDMKAAIAHPGVNAEKLEALIMDVCGETLDDSGKNFVRILSANGRLALAPAIAEAYARLRADAEDQVEVSVTSAYKLSAAHKKAISDAMKQKLGREVSITAHIDRSIMAGVIIRAGDTVIDGSVKGRLDKLALELAG